MSAWQRRSGQPLVFAHSAFTARRTSFDRRAVATGRFFVDEEVLAAEGVTDLSGDAVVPDAPLLPDLFL